MLKAWRIFYKVTFLVVLIVNGLISVAAKETANDLINQYRMLWRTHRVSLWEETDVAICLSEGHCLKSII